MSNSKVPVLLYHDLFTGASDDEKYAVSKDDFEGHLKYLSDNGFVSLAGEDVYRGPKTQSGKKFVAITFDDGDLSNYSVAFPLLRKYGFNATFFITSAWTGTEGYMDWQHLREMHEAGMYIESHGLTHVFLSDLDAAGLSKELGGSKSMLEEGLSAPVRYISLPGGFCSKEVLEASRKEGYEAVYTSVPGLNATGREKGERIVLNRFVITQKTSFEKFKAMVNGDVRELAKDKGLHFVKSVAKKVLGSQVYYSVWARFFKQVS